jgi:hypothetical protein
VVWVGIEGSGNFGRVVAAPDPIRGAADANEARLTA